MNNVEDGLESQIPKQYNRKTRTKAQLTYYKNKLKKAEKKRDEFSLLIYSNGKIPSPEDLKTLSLLNYKVECLALKARYNYITNYEKVATKEREVGKY